METERHFHWTALVISGLTAVFLWCIACSFYSKAVNLCPGVEVKWENGGVSPAALVKQQTFSRQDGAAEQPEVTLWQAASGYEVMSGDRKSMAADMVVVFGDCRAVTAAAMLSGGFPAGNDLAGCAISSGLAFSLWGSTDVCGMPVIMEGDRLYVRGVFEGEEPRIFRQAQAGSEEPLSHMQLIFSGTGTREKAEHYLLAADFSGGMILELPLIEWALGIIVRFPAIILAAGILSRVIRRGKWLWHYPALLAFWLPSALLVLAGLFFCMDLPGIPAGFIPTRWSDFAFWENLVMGHGKNVVTWISEGPTFRDMELMAAVIMTVLFSIAASVPGTIAAMRVSIRSYGGMSLGCAAYTLALSLLSLSMARTCHMIFCREKYLMPCLWLSVDFILYRQKEKLTAVFGEGRFSDEKRSFF